MALGPEGKVQILFVCTGNICRSPMAAALLQKKLSPELAQKVSIVSAGTHAMDDLPASANAQITARKMGVELADHNSQVLTPWLISHSDLILAMEPAHLEIIHLLDPTSRPRTFLLKQFGYRSKHSDLNAIIEDPIAGDPGIYWRVFQELEEEIDRIIPSISKVVERVE